MINVTKTFLPPREEYFRILERAWKSGWITNNGELVRELEAALQNEWGVKHVFYCSNGTIALQIAIKALGLAEEILTTPFSYVATTNAILWEKCRPVFVDINRRDFTMDAALLDSYLTHHSQAILATHVYGLPCDVAAIGEFAKRHRLKVIYDAAHAFRVTYRGRSLMSYGDISVCSFHATKIFHTVEGGAVVTNDDGLARRLMLLRQFGHIYDDYFSEGTNAKNSEFHAAMGLAVLPHVSRLIQDRKRLFELYNERLAPLHLQQPVAREGTGPNYGYYPVLFHTEQELLAVKQGLAGSEVFPRRYFYPSLNQLPYLVQKQSCPVSEDISRRVLCLPIYSGLAEEEATDVADRIVKLLGKG